MNKILPTNPDGKSPDTWDDTYNCVNSWRGRFMFSYAAAEHHVSEALVSISRQPRLKKPVKLPESTSHRFDHVARFLADCKNPEFDPAYEAISKFRHHEELRHHLCHGYAQVARFRHGGWLLYIQLTTFKKNQLVRTEVAIDKAQADLLLKDLEKASSQLRRELKAIGKLLSS